MSWYDEPEEKEHQCPVCDKPVDKPGLCDKKSCFDADMM